MDRHELRLLEADFLELRQVILTQNPSFHVGSLVLAPGSQAKTARGDIRRWRPAIGIIPSIQSQNPKSLIPQRLLRLPLEANSIKLPLPFFRENAPFIQLALLVAPTSELEPIRQNLDRARPAIRVPVPKELQRQESFCAAS